MTALGGSESGLALLWGRCLPSMPARAPALTRLGASAPCLALTAPVHFPAAPEPSRGWGPRLTQQRGGALLRQCFRHFKVRVRSSDEFVIAVKRGVAGDRWERELRKLLSDELLPPASPTVTARDIDSPSRVGFLVGSYAEYAVPHVWLHGDHLGPAERAAPLALEALRGWSPEDSLWLLVAELVQRVAGAARPFQVDWGALAALPPWEQSVQAALTARVLLEALTRHGPGLLGAGGEGVVTDLGRLFRAHFDHLPLAFVAEPQARRARPVSSGAGG